MNIKADKGMEAALAVLSQKFASRATFWPAPYNEDNAEALEAFIFDACETWNEASGAIESFPRLDYLRLIIREWFATMRSGRPLVIEKSRRLVVSWLLCACDVWDAGRRRCNIVQGGIDYDRASDFVYRCWDIYERLRRNHIDWKLPKATKWGNEKAQRLDKLAFANGSLIEPLNSNGESFRGSGYTRVKLEELSAYTYVGNVFSQALAVTMGAAGKAGGHVVVVANARANEEWQTIKSRELAEVRGSNEGNGGNEGSVFGGLAGFGL